MAVSGDEYYVLDRGTPQVFRLDASGRVQATVSLDSLGTYGLNGLALDADGSLYVADTGRNRILVFAPTGALIGQIGHPGSGLGDFIQPMALAFAPDGSFVVADWENGRVERWDPTWTATDAWSTGFRPFGVAVDRLGRVFVPDTDRHRVEVYTPRGDPLGELGGPAGPILDVAPRQLAFASSSPRSLYALGTDGVVRVDLEDTPPPPQPSGEPVDVASLAGIALLVAVVVGVALSRRGRRRAVASLEAPTDRPVGLDAEDRAQRQDQQPGADEKLLVAHQAERKQQAPK